MTATNVVRNISIYNTLIAHGARLLKVFHYDIRWLILRAINII